MKIAVDAMETVPRPDIGVLLYTKLTFSRASLCEVTWHVADLSSLAWHIRNAALGPNS